MKKINNQFIGVRGCEDAHAGPVKEGILSNPCIEVVGKMKSMAIFVDLFKRRVF